jgi:hypothetical protein
MPDGSFAATHWGVRPALSTAATPTPHGAHAWPETTGFADLFSFEAADELLSVRGLRTPFLRLARGGDVVASARFTRPGGVGATIADQVDPDAVAREYAAGATIVFQALHRLWPPIIEFTRRLTAEIGHPAQVNGYLTPSTAQGFSAHYDTHDVFVLQVAGSKHWTVHPPVLDLPFPEELSDRRRAAIASRTTEEPFLDTDLAPGDALYLPRGWLHSARAGAEPTLHLTVGVHALTRRDVFDAVVDGLRADESLRTSLPFGHQGRLAEAVDVVLDVLRNASADSDLAAAAVSAKLARDTRPEALRPLAQTQAAAEVTASSRVRWRAGLHLLADQVALPDRRVDVPPDDAVRVLLLGEPEAVIDLPGDLNANLELVRRLLAEAVLVPAD